MDPDTICKTQLSSTYNLRPRRFTKRKETQPDTLSVQNSKRRQQKTDINCSTAYESDLNDNKTETSSQVSVSMLRGCYKNFENDFLEVFEISTQPNFEKANCNSNEEETNAWNATGSSQENGLRFMVDVCTQTEFPALLSVQRGNEMGKDIEFVGYVVRLKAILSAKDKRTDTNLLDLLQNVLKSSYVQGLSVEEVDNRGSTLSKETVEYILRSSDTDKFFREAVQNLLQKLKNIFREDFLEVAGCWRNSVYEMAIDMLNEAVDCDPEIQKMVEYFLCEVLESISNDEGRSKNLVLESKAVLIMSFCKSTSLSFAAISFIIKELKRLNTKSQVCFSYTEKLYWSNFVKNSYFLLRILEVCLDSVMSKLKNEEPENILNKKREVKHFNVLEMWKKHWSAGETSSEERAICQWKLMVSKWFNELDEILLNCVSHFPISATAVERCKQLVKEILKICYPDERGNQNFC